MKRALCRTIGLLLVLASSGAMAHDRGRPPSQLTVTLINEHAPPPALIRAPDGRVFEFSLLPGGAPGFYDMTLLRPGHNPSARNLLEPQGNWHGLEPFEVSARPGSDPSSDMAVYGVKRDMPVRNYALVLHLEIREAERKAGKDARGEDDFLFDKLVLTVELRSAK